jgi:predicted benzoate:H+ symporter BenE
MNHNIIPLATASALVAIARPAMTLSGAIQTVLTPIGYFGLILAALAIGLIVVNNSNLNSSEEIYLAILRFGQFLLISGLVATIISFLYYSLSKL